ncbi:MAG: diguanylate cyclase, partial [Actinobacteria bacterium]|nr:diguanylate cyclase [Actinomycetota bacterium]
MPSEPSVNTPDYAVGIGSSAGGLDALEGLVAAAGNAKATAFIVAQHLAPQHPSMLAELLSRSTTLRVVTAADGQPLESNVISIAPPGSDIVVSRDRIHLVAPEAATGPNPNVDRLLSSIAEHWGDHGVGVILSGTGSDGAYGMRAIKAADGLTIVQLPGTAKFESMPNAALAFGSGDLVLDPAQIGERLSHLGDPAADWLGDEVPLPGPDALSSVLRELRRSTGIDFSRYKESTLLRQIKRRMAILQVADIDDYLPLLVAQPAEPIALMNGMLVTVTSFFRDAESFKALHDHLRDYLASADGAEQVRIWVPGCATGEEVYSIAMIMASLLTDTADLSHRLKIFGTDLDESALTIARRGAYPAASLGTVPPDLSARYLFPSGQGVEVAPELRDLVVFARHNVAQDPPFARLDLISCRNTLIYFTAPLQHRVLQMFAYGLKAGGLLFLGASEAMAADAAGFANLDSAHRLFVRTDEVVSPRRAYVPGPVSRLREPAPRRPEVTPDTGVVSDLHLDVLEALATARIGPCLVLNERHEVVEIVGDVLPYCRIAPGRPSVAIDDFVRRELAAEARALLLVVRAKGQQVASGAITLDGIVGEVRLVAAPLAVGARTFTVVEFMTEVPGLSPPMQMGDRGPEFDQELDRLEEELLRSQDTLQGSLADLETAHEELLASNEELQASSEELQSSYEELATSNEELQASNEELSISNRNLRHQTDEIDRMRRSAEESLADFTRVTDALSEVVWQRDMTLGTLIYASQGIERLLGISLSELGSDARAIDALIAPEDIDRVEAARDPRGR